MEQSRPAAPLTALILGAGFAAEGHTIALKAAGVDVVAIASRTESSLAAAAEKLEIPRWDTDWRSLLADVQPDIVAVGTPGGIHFEMIEASLQAGCHVLCDKPLTTAAADSRTLFELARDRGLKTAYAASYRYQPQTLYARELVASGRLGEIYEAEFVSHYHWPARMPFGWPHRLEDGGGRLNNNFTHKLAIAQNILGGRGPGCAEVLAVTGESRNDLKRVPIAGKVHDFREYFTRALSVEEAAECEWAEVTSDWAYTVLARLGDREAPDEAVSATFRHSGLRFGRHADYVAIYGEEGTLHIEEAYTQGPMFLATEPDCWEELTIPEHIYSGLPDEDDPTQRNWTQLACDLVDDIRGVETRDYLTFRDGWIYQEVIDVVRAAAGWTQIDGG